MAECILSVEALTVSFHGFTVIDNLDFSLERGELRFIIGPNGAGKTTLLDLITGKTRPDRGRILFNGGTDLTRRQEHDLVRLGIGRKFQTPSVFTSLTVYENLEVSIGFRSSLGGLFRPVAQKDARWIHDTLKQVGLADRSGVLAGALSHGEKQWLEIGMLLAQEPTLLLLDEPVAGMTHRERMLTGELLQKIGRDRTVVVVEHDIGFVRQFAQKVTVLHLGKILSEGSMETVSSDQQVIRAYLGRSRTRQREDAGPEPGAPGASTHLEQTSAC
jgi:urea transport system ATP-binding protein